MNRFRALLFAAAILAMTGCDSAPTADGVPDGVSETQDTGNTGDQSDGTSDGTDDSNGGDPYGEDPYGENPY
jgi:hypothetical protein